ncbi:hypothetical protein BOO71_0012520 [Deinococcus marmoris]|uniref:Uncharacterized protein n=1 Tax=Deinococcus marmoris TaxID=249408 RepID=A0A1U7NTH3_9DEIO|nr:hypothetical protein BOO71_0012520 [Deinococcus marmoris]
MLRLIAERRAFLLARGGDCNEELLDLKTLEAGHRAALAG